MEYSSLNLRKIKRKVTRRNVVEGNVGLYMLGYCKLACVYMLGKDS